jgi:anti-sigma-K factor RskA
VIDGPDTHELVAPYALGMLDDRERRRFEEHLAQCGPCREALPALEETAAALALGAEGVHPSPALRRRILAGTQGEGATGAVSARHPRSRRRPLPVAAGIAVAAAAAAIAFGLWAADLRGDLDRFRAERRAGARALAVLADPSASRYPLKGANGHVVVTPARDGALVATGVRRAPKGRTYELWVVTGGRARPAGLFRGGDNASVAALTRKVPPGARVAVTLERSGGSESPTGSVLFGAAT